MNILDVQRLIQFREVWDARQELANHGLSLRIVAQDGHHCVVTQDFDAKRANVEVSNGRVHNILSFG